MKILSVVAEVAPFSHVGGLARGTYFLAKALNKLNNDVRVFTPMHSHVDKAVRDNKLRQLRLINSFQIPAEFSSTGIKKVEIHECLSSEKNVQTYFLAYPDYFSLRSRVYDYDDDDQRFHLFSVACLEWLLIQQVQKNWLPDIIHCHDWHTGYLIDLLKRHKKFKSLQHIKVLLTVHNFKYQNITKFRYSDPKTQDNGWDSLARVGSKKFRNQNSLIRGLRFADWVNTVSPTHSNEVRLPEFGYNLAGLINQYSDKLSGIMNGLDYDDFSPEKDNLIKHTFNLRSWKNGKEKNKLELQKIFNLETDKNAFLLAYVGRMTSQKGLETLIGCLKTVFEHHQSVQFVALGDGEDHYCDLLWNLNQKYPHQVSVKLYNDVFLPRQIFAGADALLIPSNYEPGGIVALEAMRYGAVPLVRSTGGLRDSIVDFSQDKKSGNGFVFKQKSSEDCYEVFLKLLKSYNNATDWQNLVSNCLNYRHSWDLVAKNYQALFKQILLIGQND